LKVSYKKKITHSISTMLLIFLPAFLQFIFKVN